MVKVHIKIINLKESAQRRASEDIERIYDLIPVLRMCRCITPGQEGKIEKSLCYVKASFDNWVKTDEMRTVKK